MNDLDQQDRQRDTDDAEAFDELSVTALNPQESGKRAARLRAVGSWLRSRVGRVTLSALCVVLVIGALVGLLIGNGELSLQTIRSDLLPNAPTATPTLAAGGNVFIAYDTVPWGVVYVDNRRVTLTRQQGFGDVAYGFALKPGHHHIIYRAQHFPTLTCIASVPQAASDTCPLYNAPQSGREVGSANPYAGQRYLDFRATPQALATDEYSALVTAIEPVAQTVAASATVEPGESYWDEMGHTAIATTPLTYTLGLMPAQQEPLQNDSVGAAYANTASWPVTAQVTVGYAIAQPAAPTSLMPLRIAGDGTIDIATETLNVTTDESGDWIIKQPASGGMAILTNVAEDVALNSLPMNALKSGRWGTNTGTNIADGVVTYSTDPTGGTTPIVFLWRFGITYTVTAPAVALDPSLPRADAHDTALAMSILNGQTTGA